MTGSSSDLVPPPPQQLDEITQSRYERAFRQELNKVETAIIEQRRVKQSLQEEVAAQKADEHQRKKWDAEKNKRLASMEQAIVYAEEQNTKRFLKKRAEVTKRIQEEEALAEEKRQQAKEQRQQQLHEQAQAHAARMARIAQDRAAQAEKTRLDVEKRHAQLESRLASEREALEMQNAKKAEQAAKKVQHAADQRSAQIEEQHARRKEKEAALQERLRAQKEAHHQQLAANRAAAERRMQARQRAIEQQQELERNKRDHIIEERKERLEKLEQFEAKTAESRRQQQEEHSLQEMAARERSQRKLGDLQARLAAKEEEYSQRMAKIDKLQHTREEQMEYCRVATRRLAADRAEMSNSMVRLRTATNLASSDPSLAVEIPKHRRRSVKDVALGALFDRVDPDAEGHIHLPAVKKRIGKLIPRQESKPQRRSAPNPYAMKPSSSMPSLLTSEQRKKLSLREKCIAAFKGADTDDSGTISKRELIAVLRSMGLKDMKNALDLFDGFDEDGNAELDFDEFYQIAKRVLV